MQMYHLCDLGKISESVREKAMGNLYLFFREKSEQDMQNGDDIDQTDRGSFYSLRKALDIFPGACPVTDRRFNVYLIGL